MDSKYDCLKLENQFCFPLYACSKEIVRRYKPYLDALDLTYTQYITMMALWEHGKINVKEIGRLLYLDSGTLTPVIKKLEQKGLVTRSRMKDDERCLDIEITQKGLGLRDEALKVPGQVASCICIDPGDALLLRGILQKQLDALSRDE